MFIISESFVGDLFVFSFILGFFFLLSDAKHFLGIRYFNQPLNWKAKNDNFFYINGMKARCIQKEK
jgi:cupin superfamily acireductone dioxygenase involved in methionine salvage